MIHWTVPALVAGGFALLTATALIALGLDHHLTAWLGGATIGNAIAAMIFWRIP